MGIKKREKANDVNRKYQPLFGKRISFKEAFPSITEILIEVFEFEGYLRPEDDTYKKNPNLIRYSTNPRYQFFDEDNFPGEYINCSETLCYNGGFNIAKIIRNMLSENLNFKEGDASCQGYLGSPKGRKKYKYCTHEFEYRIKIIFKNNTISNIFNK